jgi:hypothetical protein
VKPSCRSLYLSSLALACTIATAQAPDLPSSLSGRWTWVQRGVSQTFALEEIKALPGKSFAASLTWWTIDPKCAIRKLPIVGTQTDTGLTFDATTKCDVSFSAEISRTSSGWTGKAATKSGNVVVVELKAN